MFVTRMLTRLALAGAATLAFAALAFVTFGATAAHAYNVDVDFRFSGLPATTAVGASNAFDIKLRNDSLTAYPVALRVFAVHLAGLTPAGITMSRAGIALTKAANGSGQVLLTDLAPVAIAGKGSTGAVQSWPYVIQFSTAAPAGNAQITFTAYAGITAINTRSTTTTVVSPGGAQASPTAAVTPAPATRRSAQPTMGSSTAAPPSGSSASGGVGEGGVGQDGGSTQEQAANGSPDLLAPVGNPARGGQGGSGVSVLFYVIGVALLGAGAVITWLVRKTAATPTR